MKLLKCIPLLLILLSYTCIKAQVPFYVGGQVTATETGFPVSQYEVFVGLSAGQILFSDLTDENGFYIIEIPPAIYDTTTTLFVWVADCNQEIQYHPFVANPNIFFDLDFIICTQNVGCLSNFGYHTDSTDRQTVYFENLSFPVTNSVNWLWDFGDGTNSGSFNPVHTYASAGTYNVCLTMADISTNCTTVFCLEIRIESNTGNCQADFLVQYDGAHELLVYFYNQSSPVNNSTHWYWDFGDGMTSENFEPMHNYYQPGTYTACLTMVDSAFSCTSSICTEITVGNNPGNCQAMFSWYSQGLSATFTDISTGSPDTWFWDFGDGTASGEPNPVHGWVQSGTYPVSLTIFDTTSFCESTYTAMVTVGDSLPDCQAGFSYSLFHSPICEFTNLSTGQPDQVIWDFGDGTTSNEYDPIHVWQFPGVYSVCLSIYNSITQCGSTYCENIMFGDTLPSCHAAYTYEQTGELTVAFTNISTGAIDQVIWDFGDGSPLSNDFNTEHTWQQPGIYQVCLSVFSNNTTCQDVLCMNIVVGDTTSGCQASFSFRLDSIPGNINHYWFIDESQGTNISSWFWDFGDGNYSYDRFPEHTYIDSSQYEVCLTIFTWFGPLGECSSTFCQTITTPAYYNLGGQIFAGNFPINNPAFTGDTAVVKLFHKTGNRLSEVASGLFYEFGYYYFLSVMEGDYVVQAGLTPESVGYQLYLPAYTGETQHWQQSQEISLTTGDIYDANVMMPELMQINTGPGMINGSIFSIDNSFVDFHDRIIFLSQSGSIVNYTRTGENGDFNFRDLPLGSYRIMAEIAGIYSQSIDINLTENVVQASDIQLQVSVSPILGLEEKPLDGFSEVSLYPNPAHEMIYLEFLLNDPLSLVAEVYTSSGVNCSKSQYSCASGENMLTFNISALKPGIYLILLKSEDGKIVNTVKFAKR